MVKTIVATQFSTEDNKVPTLGDQTSLTILPPEPLDDWQSVEPEYDHQVKRSISKWHPVLTALLLSLAILTGLSWQEISAVGVTINAPLLQALISRKTEFGSS